MFIRIIRSKLKLDIVLPPTASSNSGIKLAKYSAMEIWAKTFRNKNGY